MDNFCSLFLAKSCRLIIIKNVFLICIFNFKSPSPPPPPKFRSNSFPGNILQPQTLRRYFLENFRFITEPGSRIYNFSYFIHDQISFRVSPGVSSIVSFRVLSRVLSSGNSSKISSGVSLEFPRSFL